MVSRRHWRLNFLEQSYLAMDALLHDLLKAIWCLDQYLEIVRFPRYQLEHYFRLGTSYTYASTMQSSSAFKSLSLSAWRTLLGLWIGMMYDMFQD